MKRRQLLLRNYDQWFELFYEQTEPSLNFTKLIDSRLETGQQEALSLNDLQLLGLVPL